MRAGRLRHRVDLYRPASQAANVYGETRAEPTRVASDAVGGKWWADITPLGGSEFEDGKQVRTAISHQIRMRWHQLLNIGPGWRIVYNARNFEVSSVVTVEERNREVLIAAREMIGAFPSV